tara:strand:- start:37 stop:687 length:651 start_codon:yes stop_codon:yes gene_type:complete
MPEIFYLESLETMELSFSPISPFVRMVKMASFILEMENQITEVDADTMSPDKNLSDANPLGKIPVLRDGEKTFFDSRVILEYLDMRAGGDMIIPKNGPERFEVLTRAAMMVGILDAGVLIVYETRMRPENKYVESYVERQRDKIIRCLKKIGGMDTKYNNGRVPDVGEIGLACVLDYLDFRQLLDWRDYVPQLDSWLSDFALSVPGYKESAPRQKQ